MVGTSASRSPADRLSRRAVLRTLGGAAALALVSRPFARQPEERWAANAEVPAETPATRFDPARLAAPVTYRGTATTAILSSGADAGGRTRRTVERAATVTVAPPAAGETNPFGLRVDAASAGRAEGFDRVASAGVAFDPASGERSAVQFWDVRSDGDQLRGSLRDPSVESAPSYNVLNTFREFVPGVPGTVLLATESMVGGTTLRGRITETDLELRVSGNTLNTFADDALDLSRAFQCAVRAARVAGGESPDGDSAPSDG